VVRSAGGGLSLDSKTQLETYPPSPLRGLPPKGDSKIALNCPPSEEVALSAGGELNLDSKTQNQTYPPAFQTSPSEGGKFIRAFYFIPYFPAN
jgi:hypothetical protein